MTLIQTLNPKEEYMKKVLFVCLGNICRSPAAEGVMKELVQRAGLQGQIKCDSAGTSAYHIGEKADARMIKHAQARGYKLESLSRKVDSRDGETFDHILAMDQSNYEDLIGLFPKHQHKIEKMTSYCKFHTYSEVPDPYYGGDEGFELVLDLLEDSCQQLLIKLKKEL